MPAYQYVTKKGVMWYAKVNYLDADGHKCQHCKRGFQSQEEAELYEEAYLIKHPHIHMKPMSELLKEVLGVAPDKTLITDEPAVIPTKVYTPSDLFNQQVPNCTGIYVIYNLSKKMYYVGQAKATLRRLKQHFTGVGGNGDVYADYKYGDSFEFFIIPFDSAKWHTLDMQEKYFIEKYRANVDGYNRTKGNS